MSFPGVHGAVRRILHGEVLATSFARAIIRKAGILIGPTGLATGSGPITLLRLEYWQHFEGVEIDPVEGEWSAQLNVFNGDRGLALYQWLAGVTQVRINARVFEPEPSVTLYAPWLAPGMPTELGELYWPDNAESTIAGGGFNDSGLVKCSAISGYNTSGWIDIHPAFLNTEVFMRFQMYNPENVAVKLGMMELQAR